MADSFWKLFDVDINALIDDLHLENYYNWRSRFCQILEDYDLSSHIDGTGQTPPNSKWFGEDIIVVGWIVRSLSREIAYPVLNACGGHTARDVWLSLEKFAVIKPRAREIILSRSGGTSGSITESDPRKPLFLPTSSSNNTDKDVGVGAFYRQLFSERAKAFSSDDDASDEVKVRSGLEAAALIDVLKLHGASNSELDDAGKRARAGANMVRECQKLAEEGKGKLVSALNDMTNHI